MTQAVTIVFPHQLFEQNPAIASNRTAVLVEEWLLFRQYSFHKQKLVLHRASMQFYKSFLKNNGIAVEYVEAVDDRCSIANVADWLARAQVTEIHSVDVADNWLERRLKKAARLHGIKLVVHPTPNFLNKLSDVYQFFSTRTTYFQTDFYNWQRKTRNILLTPNRQPEGGRWSFDSENRKKIGKNERVPAIAFPVENKFVHEARQYVQEHFAENIGSSAPLTKANNGFYPTTFEEAGSWLENFLQERLSSFGVYQDAILANEHFLFHGVLTPMLNIGLLDPQQIINRALAIAGEQAVPLNSLEGFIRQILGWREFVRIVYERAGSQQRTKNYWGFNRKIPASFWTGTTGIVPVDKVIGKALKVGYSHHIERLMVMGNFMLLCEFHPDDVYKWFMEMYVDAYDWVMVPNTYGMTQFADGGLMSTKPYISGSNYLMKMSDYPKGEWQEIWDGLFWRFMHVHRDVLTRNMRLGMLIKTFDKMPREKQFAHLKKADEFLKKLDEQGSYEVVSASATTLVK